MSTEAKWKTNQKKVAFMKQFPGLVTHWTQIEGRTVERVVPLPSKASSAALIFSDGRFAVVTPADPEPLDIAAGLAAIRPFLASTYGEAYAEYDRLVFDDREALRVARLEKIIGAVHNNMKDIPELKDRLRGLVREWEDTRDQDNDEP